MPVDPEWKLDKGGGSEKNDEIMLRKIRGQNLVAIEVQCHKMCYKNHTNVLYKSRKAQPSHVMDVDAYTVFCE